MDRFKITVVRSFTIARPGGAFYSFGVGQYDDVPSWAAFGYPREYLLNGTTDPPDRPITDPGTVTVSVGSPGAQHWPQ